MARIRTIKPEFWRDELLASFPPMTRLAYIALWNEADDEGRLRAHPVYLRSVLFPYEPDLDMGEVLRPLVEARRLVLYQHDGQTYGHLPKFRQHQAINKPTKSKIPPPPDSSPDTPAPLREDSRSTPVALPDSSGSTTGGKGKEQGTGNREQGEEHAREEAAHSPADAGPPLALLPAEPPPPQFGPTELVDLWNTRAPPECPRVRDLSSARRNRAATRIREHPDPDYWRAAIDRLNASSFARGDNDRGWRADFDWLLRPDSATKTLEGKYDDHGRPRDSPAPPPPTPDPEADAARWAALEASQEAQAALARLPADECARRLAEAERAIVARGEFPYDRAIRLEAYRALTGGDHAA